MFEVIKTTIRGHFQGLRLPEGNVRGFIDDKIHSHLNYKITRELVHTFNALDPKGSLQSFEQLWRW